ncbi:MAG: filamentous hemagglutinin N-terminal domain-containing protein [Richelia sp. SM2_1_7]|nr:filamentous hemagglutinin N-terminal domain-containing protein [Richelia sp. SM2_1_7]
MLEITQNWQCFCNNLLVGTVLIASFQQRVIAQITPDNTLPNNSSITRDSNTFNINGGTQTGSNLFHSFNEFSVPTDNIASFNNAVEIQNIITRVTGNSISDINGLIKANGSANLFLINPNGIVFGENARLDIGGSFVGSTANSLKFGDGIEFSANAAQTQPLLSVNVPIGLQYGTNPGTINNQSTANNIEGESVGLEVNPGKTLALVGGDVELDGGKLSTAGSRVELGSVADAGLVRLNPIENGYSLNYEDVTKFSRYRTISGSCC